MREVTWIRRLALIGAILCFGVVVLGGYTRLSDSGLGCPDWPGCFGHVAPTGSAEHYATASDVRKAWVEMIHRYAASTLGLIIVVHRGVFHSRATRTWRERLVRHRAAGARGIPGHAGHAHRDLAAEAAHRHRSPARRPGDLRVAAVVVAVHARAAAGRRWRECVRGQSRGRIRFARAPAGYAGARRARPAGLSRRLDQQQLRRASPARISHAARINGFPMRTTRTHSCCGAA